MNIFDSCERVLIIGNGFDKNCGLKTSYIDVYQEYIKTPSKNHIIQAFKKDLSDNLNNWSDFELSMSKYAQVFDFENDFIECVDDFNAYMHEYLRTIQKEFVKCWNAINYHKNTMSVFSNSIKQLGFGVTHNIDNYLTSYNTNDISNCGFISFNYTEIFDMILKLSYDKSFIRDPIHVHGKLGDDPILGMDREDQLILKFNITDRLKRHFIKPFFNNEYDSMRVNSARTMIDNAKLIFVYGASLGESDLSWRELLINWLSEDDSHQLFIYFHRYSNAVFETKPASIDFEIQEKRKLISDWGYVAEQFPFNQLHLVCGKELFNIHDALKTDNENNQKKV